MKQAHAALAFVLGAIIIAILYPYELLLTGIVGIGCIILLAADKWKNIRRFVIAVLVGGMCENLAVCLGGWHYADAAFLFIPLWLPFGWGFSVILLEEAFGRGVPAYFSWTALALAFGGAAAVSLLAPNEGLVLLLLCAVTAGLFKFRFYGPLEIRAGLAAAILGTGMEAISIWSGSWAYSAAILEIPLWLPLCWFNAFLIMRRIMRFG